jgi:hypothetical protein
MKLARAAIAAVREYEGVRCNDDVWLARDIADVLAYGGCYSDIEREALRVIPAVRESERAACEAIARAEADDWHKFHSLAGMALKIADSIAARKGKGEV